MERRRVKNNEAGFNLIEAAIVLGIVGLVVAGVWIAAGSTYESMRQQEASRDLLSFAQNVKNFYANTGKMQVESDDAKLVKYGLVPKNMISETGKLTHPWTKNFTASTVKLKSETDGKFRISLLNLKDEVCSNLIARNAGAAGGQIEAVYIDDTVASRDEPDCPANSKVSFEFTIR